MKTINQMSMNEQSTGGQSTFARPSLKPVSELLKGTWAQYKEHFNSLVPIMLIAGIGMYLQSLFLFLGTGEVTGNAMMSSNGYSAGAVGTYGILALIAAVVYIIGMVWGGTALLNKVSKLDQPMTLGQAFTNAKPYIWPMVITGIIVGILTLIGFVLVIIPGIIVAVWLSFSLYIVIAENKKGMEAVKASKAYVQGYWWPVFGRLLLIGLIVVVVTAIIGSVGNMILGYKLGTLVQNIVSLILTPWLVIYQFALYKNVKAVKDGSAPMTAPAPQAV